MKRFIARMFLAVFIVFLLPALASAAWWGLAVKRPGSWRQANWGPSGVLERYAHDREPTVAILAARTGGFKGAFAVHSWIVVKRAGQQGFDRYDKVGWGVPVRKNSQPPDGLWYSNEPRIVAMVRGKQAAVLIDKVEQAIETYPHNRRGGYRLYPGPNSNSFVQHVIWRVPELGAQLPSNAVGRDYVPGWASFDIAPDGREIHATLGGLFGFAAGARSGLEVHFLGLVAGVGILRPSIKIPAFGQFDLFSRS
jgi:hypothetical protein